MWICGTDVVAAEDSVDVSVYDTDSDSTNTYTLTSQGDFEEISTDAAMHIVSTGPIVVAQYSKTGEYF